GPAQSHEDLIHVLIAMAQVSLRIGNDLLARERASFSVIDIDAALLFLSVANTTIPLRVIGDRSDHSEDVLIIVNQYEPKRFNATGSRHGDCAPLLG
ncbi:MAG TPA: hypothetical protein VMD06_00005, partial [Steroidobacteraceae bacterium]|nr:hypothetical protein [Steroidobacteraceae bacterium]